MTGYVKIDRKILDWEWYKDINTKVLFLHCLLKANWKDGKFEGKIIPKGSFVSSLSKLSIETYLSVREVRTALEHLKSTGELTVIGCAKYSMITVNNYCTYQLTDTKKDIQLAMMEEKKNIKAEEDKITASSDVIIYAEIRHIMEKWNELQSFGIKPVIRLSKQSKRYGNLVSRIKEYGCKNVLYAIEKIKTSDYCRGRNKYGWVITFDWFVLPNNFPKIFEGNYDNRNGGTAIGKFGRSNKSYNDRLLPDGRREEGGGSIFSE